MNARTWGPSLLAMRQDRIISRSVMLHLLVIAGFVVGMFAGFTFILIGPVWLTRMLGLFAMACGALGIVLMALALRDHLQARTFSSVRAA